MSMEGSMGGTEKPKKDEDNFGTDEEHKNSRLAFMITRARLNNYEELNHRDDSEKGSKEKNKTAGDKIAAEKAKEVWKKFAIHGRYEYKEGRKIIKPESDLDGACCLKFMEEAEMDVSDVIFSGKGRSLDMKGRIYMDTGEEDGIVLADSKGRKVGEKNDKGEKIGYDDPDLGMTAFLDHHGKESAKGTCATKLVYDTLVEMGRLKRNDRYEKLVEFVRQVDSAEFKDWNEEKYRKSYKTIRGIQGSKGYRKAEEVFKFFKKDINPDPDRELSSEEMETYGIILKNKQTGKIAKNFSEEKYKRIDESIKALKEKQENGFVIDSGRYGKIVIDVDGKVKDGFETSLAFGADTHLRWNPEKNNFFLSAKNGISDKDRFNQDGIKLMRETMLFKNSDDGKPLTMKLKEVIDVLTDGKAKIEKGLAEYIEKEKEENPEKEKKGEEKENGTPDPWEKSEDEKKLDVIRKMREKIDLAEKDWREADEERKVSRAFFRMNAYGVAPFEPLSEDDTINFRKSLLRNECKEMKANFENLKKINENPEKARLFLEEEEKYRKKLRENKEKVQERVIETNSSLNFFRSGYTEVRKKKRKIWTKIRSIFSKKYRDEMKGLEDVAFSGYLKTLDIYRKSVYDEIKSRGLEGEEERSALSEARKKIDLVEYLSYYSGNDDFIKDMEKKEKEKAKKEKEKNAAAEKDKKKK